MKQRYYESGPKATKLLAWRLRKQQGENTIHKIRDHVTKKITTSIDCIQMAFENDYASLYSQKEHSNETTILKFLTP